MPRLQDPTRFRLEYEMSIYLFRETGISQERARELIRDLGMEMKALLQASRKLMETENISQDEDRLTRPGWSRFHADNSR